jgi:hypothetical protein
VRLAGVMGMNFQIGLFENPNLFWVVIASMALFALTTLISPGDATGSSSRSRSTAANVQPGRAKGT